MKASKENYKKYLVKAEKVFGKKPTITFEKWASLKKTEEEAMKLVFGNK